MAYTVKPGSVFTTIGYVALFFGLTVFFYPDTPWSLKIMLFGIYGVVSAGLLYFGYRRRRVYEARPTCKACHQKIPIR